MAHRSGGGSHSGGHHSSHHSSSHGSGGRAPRYSNRPYTNARRFRYYDRNGVERYLYADEMPQKSSIFFLIFRLVFFIPFIFGGIFSVIAFLITLSPMRPLKPEYEPTDVHIMDTIGVIDNEDSLEEVLQKFEDTTGISPLILTVHDDAWKGTGELWEFAYSIYVDAFSDEQHFLIVYSEPENAEELEFVDWSWEGIQGDDTDRILTDSKVDRFGRELQNYLDKNNTSVGEAFEIAFEESLTYMMDSGMNSSEVIPVLLFAVIWNAFIIFAIVSLIKSYRIGKREYQEVPMEGASNMVSGAMGYGTNAAYQNGTAYQSGAGSSYQSSTTFQGDANYQGGQGYQGGQVYQSSSTVAKKYMYYDKNGNKKYVTTTSNPKSSALIIMVVVLIITVPMLFFAAVILFGLILMVNAAADSEVVSSIMPMLIGTAIVNVGIITGIVCAVRHYKIVKKREYIEVSNESFTDSGSSMPNQGAAQYNAGTQYNGMQYGGTQYNGAQYGGTQYNAGTQYGTAQYNTGTQYGGTQYNAGTQYGTAQNNTDASQYNTAGAAGNDYFNDESRFRGPEYYDDDARYRGSTAYEAGKK